MKQNNQKLIEEYARSRQLKKTTYFSLKSILKRYSEFHDMSLAELLEEADREEEEHIRWKHRTLKTRLTEFMLFLLQEVSGETAKAYLRRVKSFYNHHEIEIHYLPKFKINSNKGVVRYRDLPDHDIIKSAVELGDLLMKAVVLFMSSSGCSRADTLKITIKDFIIATRRYHNSEDITDVVNILLSLENVIPTFESRRQKTGRYYLTFCSPEAVEAICNYLLNRISRRKLSLEDKLFKISKDRLTIKFEILNDEMGLGRVNFYNRFRSHMLRKFHASNLERAGMSRGQINLMQGKSNGAVDDVYFFEDEEKLREDYISALGGLLIFTEVKEITQYSPEYLEMQKQNEELKVKIREVDDIRSDLENIKKWFIQ